MRKIFATFVLITLALAGTAEAGGKHQMGNGGACFYDSKPGSNKWHYYFCGQRSEKCDGKKDKGKNDTRQILNHLETFTFVTDSRDTYCCCNGSLSSAGTFINAGKDGCFTDKVETATKKIKDLGDGTVCTQYIRKTVCGTEELVDCDQSDGNCSSGYRKRKGACVQVCSGDSMAYASETSNECVSCPTTMTQGAVPDKDEKGNVVQGAYYCVKCDTTSEFFDSKTKKCKSKDDFKKVTANDLGKCWRCPFEVAKDCAIAVQNGTIDSNSSLKNKCHI